MKFAQLHAGQIFKTGTATLNEAEIVAFARGYDPQWFHTDAERAQRGPFGGLIASGWQTCGIAMRLAAQAGAPLVEAHHVEAGRQNTRTLEEQISARRPVGPAITGVSEPARDQTASAGETRQERAA